MASLKSDEKSQSEILFKKDTGDQQQMLLDCGYSERAVRYFIEQPYMGSLPDADQISEMVGSCGDTAKIFLKIDQDEITDIRYQILGCPGAISAAMATVDIVKGKSLDQARTLNDGHVFTQLVDLPAKKHHCIQLAVKALHKAIDEYKNGHSDLKEVGCQSACSAPQDCCKKK
ncbi:MAG: iron-sulfur cluster assembly scaffold protein [Deltaproteobacteria bacterium]|nr:iron-sulfur cluster assembly scaffold protein [Deltaproteobacteria bacterium]